MIPNQETANMEDPSEHFVWALRNMPTIAGIGAVTHPGFLKEWSTHLWKCAFAHRDYLVGLADENGMIHISQLPKQTIRLQEAFRGPRNLFNNAARWVPEGTPDPVPVQIPNIAKMTQQERDALLGQFRATGEIRRVEVGPDLAHVMEEGSGDDTAPVSA